MYLPRHHQHEAKRNNTTRNFVLLIVLITLVGFGIYKRREISFLFSGNIPQKQVKFETKVIEQIIAGAMSKETVNDYISASKSLLQSQGILPRSYHAVAKGYYYELILKGYELSNKKIHQIALNETDTLGDFKDFGNLLDEMYFNALKARAIPGDFPEYHSNQMLILLYQMIEGRKNSSVIFSNLQEIQFERITPDLRPIYVWLSLSSAVSSGQKTKIEKAIVLNNSLGPMQKIKLTDRDIGFLKGLASFKEKNYIEALISLREVKKDFDFLTIEAIKLEAEIFLLQNLPEKSISLLEALYFETGSKDEKIKERIHKIILAKPKLKSKLNFS